jgi:CBS domain-containing protein
MKISDVMTRDVEIAYPGDTLQTAARMMADIGSGVLPVGENDRLVGMLTDRDITVRAVAEGRAPDDCTVRDVMTTQIRYCFEDEDIGQAARLMAENGVRRLPVLNRGKRLVGIISLGDIAAAGQDTGHGGEALGRIADTPGTGPQQSELRFAGNKPRQGS